MTGTYFPIVNLAPLTPKLSNTDAVIPCKLMTAVSRKNPVPNSHFTVLCKNADIFPIPLSEDILPIIPNTKAAISIGTSTDEIRLNSPPVMTATVVLNTAAVPVPPTPAISVSIKGAITFICVAIDDNVSAHIANMAVTETPATAVIHPTEAKCTALTTPSLCLPPLTAPTTE